MYIFLQGSRRTTLNKVGSSVNISPVKYSENKLTSSSPNIANKSGTCVDEGGNVQRRHSLSETFTVESFKQNVNLPKIVSSFGNLENCF